MIKEFNEQVNPAPQTLDEQAQLVKEGKIDLPSHFKDSKNTKSKPKISY
jgi:hypothetical protein